MSLALSTVQSLNDLVARDAALYERLCNAADKEEFASILTTVALANGLTVDGQAMSELVDKVIELHAENGELSDEQLEKIVGGLDPVLGCILGGVIVGAIVAAGVLVASEIIRAVNRT